MCKPIAGLLFLAILTSTVGCGSTAGDVPDDAPASVVFAAAQASREAGDLKTARDEAKQSSRRLEAARASQEKGSRRLKDKVSLREDQLAEKVKRLSILYEAGQALASTLELDNLLSRIVKLAARHLKSRKASLMLIEEGTDHMRINSSVGIRKWIVEKARITVGKGPAGMVAVSGKPMLIRDISTDSRFMRPSRGTYKTGSFMSVPLKMQDKVLGVLNIADKRSEGPFDEDDLNLTITLAAEAAIAVENAKLYQDLKEKMASLQELYREREAERRQLLTLINSITDGILAVDLEGSPLFINKKARSMLVSPSEEKEGLILRDILEPGDLSRCIIEGMDSALSSASASREISLEEETGGKRHFEIVSLPIRERGGDLIGALTVVRDITEFKELDRIRSDFLTHASHQLKTPVGLIQGFADTIIKYTGMEEERRRHFLDLIHTESHRLGNIIENLLDFTRLESRTLPVVRERFHISEVLGNMLPAIEGEAEQKGIGFSSSLAEALPALETDRDCLMEVLQNILDNSLKFTPRGGEISIGIQQRDDRLEIVVTDNGVGIEDDDLPHIFDKFYVGRATGRPGTGLGLYLAKEIIDSLEGSLSVTSRGGEGTVVRILLPQEKGGEAGAEGPG